MQAFYEKWREDADELNVSRSRKHTFAPHFHINVEIFVVRKGCHAISCNGKNYTVKDGDAVIFNSYDIHSYDTKHTEDVDDCVLVLPLKYLSSFYGDRINKRFKDCIIHDAALVDKILMIVDEIILKTDNDVTKSAAANLILSCIAEKTSLIENVTHGENELILKILRILNDGFTGDVSLSYVSKKLGYAEEHLSRVFHKYMQTGIPSYVNKLRLEYAEELINKKGKNVTEAIFIAGFKSTQSYYRNKKRFFYEK